MSFLSWFKISPFLGVFLFANPPARHACTVISLAGGKLAVDSICGGFLYLGITDLVLDLTKTSSSSSGFECRYLDSGF